MQMLLLQNSMGDVPHRRYRSRCCLCIQLFVKQGQAANSIIASLAEEALLPDPASLAKVEHVFLLCVTARVYQTEVFSEPKNISSRNWKGI